MSITMNTAKEFNIRSNYPPTKDRRVKQETVYHYYWYRIITAALLISALITALVSGALNYLKQQSIASKNAAITTTQATYDSRPAVLYKAQMTAMQPHKFSQFLRRPLFLLNPKHQYFHRISNVLPFPKR